LYDSFIDSEESGGTDDDEDDHLRLLRLTTVLPCLPPPPTASILTRDREKSLIARIILFWDWGSKNPNFLNISLQTKDTKWEKGF
jgi:hypothetical protein